MSVALPELERLTAWIPGDSRTGTSPSEDSFDSPLVQFRMLCRKAVRSENADDSESRIAADKQWSEAVDKGLEIIESHWKDLTIAAMLLQALARTHGVAGVAFGFRLATGLVSNFWDDYRIAWDDDFETHMKVMDDLNSTLLPPLRRQQIATAGDGVRFFQVRRAQELEGVTEEERSERLARGEVSMSDLRQRVADTPDSFYEQLLADVADAREAVEAFDQDLYERLDLCDHPEAAPATSQIKELLEDIEMVVRDLLGSRLAPPEPEVAADEQAGAEGGAAAGAAMGRGPVTPDSRDAAFRQLTMVADYLERLERQSLVPMIIRYGVWLGQLSPRRFYEYFNQHGEQLFQIMEPVLGSSPGEDQDLDS